MLQTKVVEKIKTCVVFPKLFFNKPPIYETMWKNSVEPGRPQATICCMHISYWTPKATHTHSEYVILFDFPLQHWLHERASVLGYMYVVCVLNMSVLISTKIIII
jgi:hypothetical protein